MKDPGGAGKAPRGVAAYEGGNVLQPTCHRCGTTADPAVLVDVIERGTGPAIGVYACLPCAQNAAARHRAYCALCATAQECVEAASMAELLDAAQAVASLGAGR